MQKKTTTKRRCIRKCSVFSRIYMGIYLPTNLILLRYIFTTWLVYILFPKTSLILEYLILEEAMTIYRIQLPQTNKRCMRGQKKNRQKKKRKGSWEVRPSTRLISPLASTWRSHQVGRTGYTVCCKPYLPCPFSCPLISFFPAPGLLSLHDLAKQYTSQGIIEKEKVDRKHGKRPLPSNEEEEKEADHIFPIFSSRSQQDMSAMVSALTQVISNRDQNPVQVHGNPLNISQSSAGTTETDQSQPTIDQGMKNINDKFFIV